MPDNVIEAAIANLERAIEEHEQKIRGLRMAINTLCENVGMAPRYEDAALSATSSTRVTTIRDDTFYGKRQTSAMREYLEMRKTQGMGPASPREIYEALKTGGYQFESKDETVALVGMRALLRTQPNVFHKLPQGTYGLTAWYPDAPKRSIEERSARKGKRSKRKHGAAKHSRVPHETATADNVVDLKTGTDKTA